MKNSQTYNSGKTFNRERVKTNLDVLRQLKTGQASPETLRAYTGWGGLREAVYNPDIYRQLKAILSLEEIAGLKRTLGNAYYTPAYIVQFIYQFLTYAGFKGGAILEPAIGNGVFIEHLPATWQAVSTLDAVELDSVTGQITQALYPFLNVQITPFEAYQPVSLFDLIIGNPPYGRTQVKDLQHRDLSAFCIHHYFVAKSMRLLNKGGWCAMVLPSYFLDNASQHVRHIIAQEGGGLVAAYRLPEDCFSDAKVTVDIVFLQKGHQGPAWTTLKEICIGDFTQSLNHYFHQHSHHILGNLEVIDLYGRKGLACKSRGDVQTLLAVELQRLKNAHQISTFRAQQQATLLHAIEAQRRTLEALQQEVLALI